MIDTPGKKRIGNQTRFIFDDKTVDYQSKNKRPIINNNFLLFVFSTTMTTNYSLLFLVHDYYVHHTTINNLLLLMFIQNERKGVFPNKYIHLYISIIASLNIVLFVVPFFLWQIFQINYRKLSFIILYSQISTDFLSSLKAKPKYQKEKYSQINKTSRLIKLWKISTKENGKQCKKEQRNKLPRRGKWKMYILRNLVRWKFSVWCCTFNTYTISWAY